MVNIISYIVLALLVITSVVWLMWSDKIWAWLVKPTQKSYTQNNIRR